MENLLSEFTGLYPLSKTLRFELKPVEGFNYEEFINSNLFKSDTLRAKSYPEAKKIIDEYHKAFINSALNDANLDW